MFVWVSLKEVQASSLSKSAGLKIQSAWRDSKLYIICHGWTLSALYQEPTPLPNTHTRSLYLSMTTCMKEHIQPTVTETDRHYYLRGCGGRQRQAVQLWLQSKDQETPHTNPDPDSCDDPSMLMIPTHSSRSTMSM